MLILITMGMSIVVTHAETPTLFRGLSSRLSNLRFMAVPVVSTRPETNWGFGAAGSYFFNIGESERLSYLDFSGEYTLERQWSVGVSSLMYFSDDRWLLRWSAGYHHYPYYYYGQNNEMSRLLTDRVAYMSDEFSLRMQPQYRLNSAWAVGVNANVEYHYARTDRDITISGMNEKLLIAGIGAVFTCDTRDRIYYPSKGVFFKTQLTGYSTFLNRMTPIGHVSLDYRQYITIYKQLLLAWQLRAETMLGRDIPFYMLPTFDGQDLLRGVRSGLFRDEVLAAAQAELRFPIWQALRGCLFAGVGDVYHYSAWHWATPKVGYGAGLRVAVNNDMVNIRFDVARNNYNHSLSLDGWYFYLTLKEAF